MPELIFVGAGAIGRGYLPWVFSNKGYDFTFIDSRKEIIDQMNKNRNFETYMVKNEKLQHLTVPIKKAYLPEQFEAKNHQNVVTAFISTGPRNCVAASQILEGIKCPIILCENDINTVNIVKNETNRREVYFAIPDVITSNTASSEILAKNPLAVISEDGTLFVENGIKNLKGNYISCNQKEIKDQWTAKLYLHNTPHCIAAYLGAIAGVKYIHEAMEIIEINTIVSGAMQEMLRTLKLLGTLSHEFLDWYAKKELKRFSCKLLFDPITRVAREPLRKLEYSGRLIGAAQLCLSRGVMPCNIIKGIAGAILFNDEVDHHLPFITKSLTSENSKYSKFTKYILGIREGEALEIVMKNNLERSAEELEALMSKYRA